MKIKEAVNVINSTMTVRAKVDDGVMYVHKKLNRDDDWFMRFSLYHLGWSAITADFDNCLDDDVDVTDLARVMDVVQRLICTPVKERFPEKKYRLVANPNSLEQTGTYATKYVACIQDGVDGFSFVYGGPTVFSEKELKQIEELHPNIAPAIDTMKEEVKDNEAD